MKKGYTRKALLALLSFSFIHLACEGPEEGGTPVEPQSHETIIGIEGVGLNGISSVAIFNNTTTGFENNLFRKANVSPLGARLSSILVDEELQQIAFVLPGSERVTFANLKDFKEIRRISNLPEIRSIEKVQPDKYYLSTWEFDGIHVINPLNHRVRNTFITDRRGPSAILAQDDLAFICNSGNFIDLDSMVTVVRNTEDTICTQLSVGINPNSMVIDQDNQLWVLCAGLQDNQNPSASGVGSLWRFNVDTMRMAFDSGYAIAPDTVLYLTDNQLKPSQLTYSETLRTLYFLGGTERGHVYAYFTQLPSLVETPMIEGQFYGLRYDGETESLIALRTPQNIEENGDFQIYAPNGALRQSIRVGVRPRHVAFR